MASSRTWIALLLVLVPCTLWAHADLDEREAQRAAQQPWPDPPPELALKLSSLGFRHFASDMMWLAAIQYFGAQRNLNDGHFRLLVPFLDRVVALDPLFEYAYRFGGVAAVGPAGENIEQANDLLKRGQAARPDIWRIPYIRASNCLQHTSDQKCMAEGFSAAAALPESPEWLGLLASRHLKAESRASEAFELLARLVENTTDPMIKLRVEERLGALQMELDLQSLNQALSRYRERRGEEMGCPLELSELIDNRLTQIPRSPTGAPYEIGDSCELGPPGFAEIIE